MPLQIGLFLPMRLSVNWRRCMMRPTPATPAAKHAAALLPTLPPEYPEFAKLHYGRTPFEPVRRSRKEVRAEGCCSSRLLLGKIDAELRRPGCGKVANLPDLD